MSDSVAFVPDRPHHASLCDQEADDLALLAVLDLQPQVVEVSGVPQDHEVAAQRLGVEQVAPLGEDAGRKAVARNPPRATEDHVLDDVLAGSPLLHLLLLHVLEGRLRLGRLQRNVLERGDRLLGLGEQVRGRGGRDAGLGGTWLPGRLGGCRRSAGRTGNLGGHGCGQDRCEKDGENCRTARTHWLGLAISVIRLGSGGHQGWLMGS